MSGPESRANCAGSIAFGGPAVNLIRTLRMYAVAPREALHDTPRLRQGMNISVLGEPRFPSPIRRTVDDRARIPAQIVRVPGALPQEELLFELAGPRDKLFFDPKATRCV